jgi:hypothetical protein
MKNFTARLNASFATVVSALMLYLRPAPSVVSITAQFDKTYQQLLDARERHNAEAKAAEEAATKLIRKAIASRAEAGRAHRVAGRVNELIS